MSRILLIEDNPANLELMRYLLGAFGYTPRTAVNGAEGLGAARAEPFDLIVCDIHMPNMDGYEVARQLKADPNTRAIPLVAITALAMVGDRDKVLAAGFDGYISKPVDPDSFVRQIEEFLPPTMRKHFVTPVSTASEIPRHEATGLVILVVDNLAVNLDLARSLLEPLGYRVRTAQSIAAALPVAREHPCDLILSDVCMGGESGYDLIRAVKADSRLRDIPFVFITSTFTNEADRTTGLSLGAVRYLFRPIEPDVLLAEIEACLREAGRFVHGNDSDRR